jgi:hypothetical protein
MVTLGSSFAGLRYVSDVLEGFLDAGATREATRAYCRGLIADVPSGLRVPLAPIAEYVGGKCMGYPAIWFLEQLLIEPARTIIGRCRSSLCVSLSTSIVDDLADGDESFGPEYLAFLYVLIGEAIHAGTGDDSSRALLLRALDVSLNPEASSAHERAVRRGERIGAFFAMIAASAVRGVLPESRAAVAIQATVQFGEVCAHIDDWMDAPRDLRLGTLENVALALLRERVDGQTPRALDLAHHSDWLDGRMRELLAARMRGTISLLDAHEFRVASAALRDLLERCQESTAHV